MKFAAAVVGALLIGAAPASAQNSIGDAVLGLWNGVADAPVQIVNGRIYGGTIEATVRNLDGVGASLGAGDQISAFRISRNGQFLEFPADLDPSRAAFNRWVNDNAGAILALLFPASVSESVTGRDAAQTYAQQFQKDGGVILQRDVLDIELGPNGPQALLTDAGRMEVDTLILCAGVHSGKFSAKLGDTVPLEAERGYHVTFSDPGLELPMPVASAQNKLFVTPMEMGTRIAGQTEFAGIEAPPDYGRADVLARHMKSMFPQVRDVETTRWMGRRPSMPDSRPVIGRATKYANTYYAFGHGHIGLVGSAPTGRIIADLVAGRTPNIDIAPFRVDRF